MASKDAGSAGASDAADGAAGEIQELLETETHVDMEKLLTLCQLGVPDQLRAEAWKYMLGVSRPERSEEMSLRKRMELDYVELEKAWREHAHGELARAVKAEVKPHRTGKGPSWDARTRTRLESVLRSFMHAQGEQLVPGTVYLLRPLVHIYSTDVDAYYCFQELMKRLEWILTFEGTKQMHVMFMTLLRQIFPELYSFFEEENCSGGAWLTSWLQFLLSRNLPLPCVLRLWDTYLAYRASRGTEAMLQLHIYVCLAILEVCSEELMELDDADTLWYLNHLPTLDMQQVIMQAINIQDDVIARSILDPAYRPS